MLSLLAVEHDFAFVYLHVCKTSAIVHQISLTTGLDLLLYNRVVTESTNDRGHVGGVGADIGHIAKVTLGTPECLLLKTLTDYSLEVQTM
jgi:hypothetical protein